MSTLQVILSLIGAVAFFLVLWCIDIKKYKNDRVKRLEDDQRYINNKRNGWDW